MKIKLLIAALFFNLWCFSQAVIELNPNSCGSDTGLIEITSGTFYISYQWFSMPIGSTDDFQPIPNATSPNFSFDWTTFNQSIIKVRVQIAPTIFYFSNDLFLNMEDCNLAVSDVEQVSEIRIFPNPATDFMKVKGVEIDKKVEIFNALGQMVFVSDNYNSDEIDVSSFLPGIYYLITHANNKEIRLKFVKS